MPIFKFVLSSFILLLSLFVVIPVSQAAKPDFCTDPDPSKIVPPDKIVECWTAEAQVYYTAENLACAGLPIIGAPCPFLPKTPARAINEDGEIQMTMTSMPQVGAMPLLASAIGSLYTPPTSTVQYLAMVKNQIIPIEPAYAQVPTSVPGSGSGIIVPVLGLWTVTRNFAYLGFMLIFLVVGFMIMFRQKINPQTVISVQAALPGLVVGLILVTFSYFISALLVDFAFVGTQLVARIFSDPSLPNAFGDPNTLAQNANVLQLFTSSFRLGGNINETTRAVEEIFTGTSRATAGHQFENFFGAIVQGIAFGLVGLMFGGQIGLAAGAVGGIFGAVGVSPLTFAVGILVPLVLIIALIIQFFRLFFHLINAYLSIIISTVIAPFIILFSSLPGKGGILSVWWKTILGNALIFPAVFGVFMFAGLILSTPVEAWSARPPLFGNMTTGYLRLIIAYGLLLGSPAVPNMVKQALGVKDIRGIPEAAMGGAMSAFGVGRGAVSRGVNATGLPQARQAYREGQNRWRAGTSITAPSVPVGVPGAPGGLARRIIQGRW